MEDGARLVLGQLPENAGVTARCSRCSRLLGNYATGRGQESFQPIMLFMPYRRGPSAADTFLSPGRRRGAGVHVERFGDRLYQRVKCKCGLNQKVRASMMAGVPVVRERGAIVVYIPPL
jgi:hypothetical protein